MTPETISSIPERTRDALSAAHLYYIQNLTMGTIASELNTSRSSVSRLLSYARDTGLVEIQIRSPLDRASEIQARIADRYSVAAHIAPVPDRTGAADRLERVAILAARLLPQYFDSNMTLGIAWGSTMSAVSRHLVPKSTHNSVIVQLNGAGNNLTSGIVYASEILRRFGDAFGASVEQFAVPAFFDDPATKLALWQERSTIRVLEIQQNMDVALFGLGSPLAQVPSHVFMGGYLESADYATLSKDDIVGDVATVFYRADGSSDGIALNQRGSGPDLATLRGAARRVCVVSGISKLQSLRGALAAGAMTDLICDEGTAQALVEDHD
jgi:deoxyribonucleoside regulator